MCHTVLKLFGISPYGNWVGDEEESVVSSIRVSESLGFPACITSCINYLEAVCCVGLAMRKQMPYHPYGNFTVKRD
uniref:Uncharacterized protein n=1 Tax=Oryza punctata TaxID=4537 RepID=A0A0E0LGJ5_ORYPU